MSVFCQSPIILTQSNFPAPTIGVPLEDVTSQVTTAPATGSNQTWDCSTLTTGISASNNFVTVSNNPYIPGAQFMLATYFKNITPQLGFYYDQYYAISSAGAYVVGIHVPAQAFGIGALTGRAADSLYVLDTFINYSTPTVRPVMTFPATDGSVWHTTNLRHMINLQLTDSAYHLNRFSIQQVFYFNRVDSVAGWGTLKLPAQAGFNNNVPVLQEMLQQYYIDSFFVGGALAPRTLTSAFGITQGQNTGAAYRMLFYRDGEFNYQMLFNFTDNTFSTPNAVLINDHLPFYTGINDLHNDRSSAVYPNPITGSHFTIRMSSQAQASTITISDLSGREIQTMTPSIYGNSLKVEMSKPLSEGMYIYTIKDAAGNTLNTGKITADK
jgi:hypothetical protein